MKPQDRKAFLEVVVGFAELKGKQLSAPALELYWNAMQTWSLEEFRKAAEHLLRSCEFMPVPKDFEDLRKAGRRTAGEAWALACSSTSSAYTPTGYRGGTSGDALIDQCVHMIGGYSVIAMCDEAKLHFLERRFCEHYESLEDADDVREALPQIAAKGALTNLRRGLITHKN